MSPKARPVILHPLDFHTAMKGLLAVKAEPLKPKKKRGTSRKPRKTLKRS